MGELFTQFDRMNQINRTIEAQMETLNDQVSFRLCQQILCYYNGFDALLTDFMLFQHILCYFMLF